MSKRVPFFSVIITSFNEGHWLHDTIDSILGDTSYPHFETIAVNDGSTDDSFDFLKKPHYEKLVQAKRLTVIHGENLGVGKGRNMGAKKARGDILIFLDAHMHVESGWLQKIADTLLENPHIKLLGITCCDWGKENDTTSPWSIIYTLGDYGFASPQWLCVPKDPQNKIISVPVINAACFIIERKVFTKVGGFPEFLLGWGPEDRFLSLKCYYYGYRCYFNPDISIQHRFQKPEEQTLQVQSRKNHLLYNCLACAFILYDNSAFIIAKRELARRYPEMERSDDYRLFQANQKKLSLLKHKLSKTQKSSYQDFIREYQHYLPHLAIGAYHMGVVLTETDPIEAEQELQRALEIQYPLGELTVDHVKGAAYWQLAELHKSVAVRRALSEAFLSLQHFPQNLPLYHTLIDLYFTLNQHSSAIPYILTATELIRTMQYKTTELNQQETPSYVDIDFWKELLAIAYHYSGQYDQAINELGILLQKKPTEQRLINNMTQFKEAWEHNGTTQIVSMHDQSIKVRRTNLFDGVWELFRKGLWEPHTFTLLEYFLAKGSTFIDVGAWIGPMSLYGARLGAEVYAVEPDPRAIQEFVYNTKQNRSLQKHIHIFEGCIADHSGIIQVNSNSGNEWGRSISSILTTQAGLTHQVSGLTFEEYLHKNHIPLPGFIKIDIEGGESIVIPSMKSFLKKHTPNLYLSIHSFWFKDEHQGLADIQEALQVYPYLYKVTPEAVTPITSLSPGLYEILATREKLDFDSYTHLRNKLTFSSIHSGNAWGDSESVSGPGSSLAATTYIRQSLPTLLKNYKINSLLDLPCGDYNWFKELGYPLKRYIGGDIVSKIISDNQKAFSTKTVSFQELDITQGELPQVDLILCRDLLPHLRFTEILAALRSIRNSQSRYLLTTTFPKTTHNSDIVTGGWRPLNLQLPPFNLPPPLEVISETPGAATSQLGGDKTLALWRIKDLPRLVIKR